MKNVTLLKKMQTEQNLENNSFNVLHSENSVASEYLFDVGRQVLKNKS